MTGKTAIAGLVLVALCACQTPKAAVAPSIEFTRLPPAGDGNPDALHAIEGRAVGTRPGERVVLFARSGIWWVQPTADHPFTAIAPDTTWKNSTHPGSAYAALLVTADYLPPSTVDVLPKKGGAVLAVALAEGAALAPPTVKTIQFGGYEWTVREAASDRGGTRNYYEAGNVWTDANGFLHLRIARKGDGWTSAEVKLGRSLGYGSYRFVVRDVSHLEPAAVFSIFTWDDDGPPREMNIEISRWGESASKNAQYVVQPYFVPANAVRFVAPAGLLTHWFRWESGRATFKTARGAVDAMGAAGVAEHVFTSGIPSAGNESIHANLYVFGNRSNPLRHECEVVIEKFEYLP
jgi:hypothetical protein